MLLEVYVTYKTEEDTPEERRRLCLVLERAAEALVDNGWLTVDDVTVGETTHSANPAPLRETVDDANREHDVYDRVDWVSEVFHRNTNLGYWDWVENQIEDCVGDDNADADNGGDTLFGDASDRDNTNNN